MKVEWVIKFDGVSSVPDKVLSGLSVGVKDLFHIAGVATSAGNPDWLSTHKAPASTSSSIIKLQAAGASVVGKTLTDELAYSLNGQNIHYGTPLNYTAPQRIPGGSSSGSAAVVASGEVDIGLGTDTGGSIRVPASYNGLFGLRPTHGLIPMDNMVPLAPSFDTVGWLTRDLQTLENVAQTLLLKSDSDTPKHLVVLKPTIAGNAIWNLECENWLDSHAQYFESVVEVFFEPSFFAIASASFRCLQGHEIWQMHGEWIQAESPGFAPDISARFKWCQSLTSEMVVEAKQSQQSVIDQLNQTLVDDNSVMLLPTTPGAAPLLNSAPECMDEYRIQLMGLTALAGLTGRPQLHLPVLKDQNAPWGLSLLGAKGSDMGLIKLAKALLKENNA